MDQPAEPSDVPAVDVIVFPPPPLVATVIVAPVPAVPPASLAGFVDPLVDDRGLVVDWAFGRVQRYGAVELQAYREWRNSWERTWELGPLANLRSLQRIVAGLDDVGGVAALLGALVTHPETVRIGSTGVADLTTQLDAVRAAIAANGGQGAAIVDQTPRRRPTVGFSRTWATPSERELLAANGTTGVAVDPDDGLVVFDQATGEPRIADVVDVDLRGEAVVVENRRGETIDLESVAARPIAWIVPSSVHWKVRPIPKVVVWSALFSRLPDALSVAAATDGVISFTIDRDS